MQINFFLDDDYSEKSVHIIFTKMELLVFKDNLIMLKKNFEDQMNKHSLDGINFFISKIEEKIPNN